MKGVVLLGDRKLEIREFDVPIPGYGQVLIKMKSSGLCGSDLRAIYRPRKQGSGPETCHEVIAGHEPCGQIENIGPGVKNFKLGDRVIVYHIAGCGYCHNCRKGWMINCTSPERAAYGWERNGGHADFLLAEANTLVSLPDHLSFDDGALVACGLGTAYEACRKVGVSGRDFVLVTGLGPVGLGTVFLAKVLGARVIGVEPVPERIKLAEKVGADLVLKPEEVSSIKSYTNGHGVEVAIDCSGNVQARYLCLKEAREWGRIAFIGEGGSISFEPSPLLIHKQLTLYGTWVCGLTQMEELVELLSRWGIHPEKIITHRFKIDQAKDAYEHFDEGKTGKIVIVWD